MLKCSSSVIKKLLDELGYEFVTILIDLMAERQKARQEAFSKMASDSFKEVLEKYFNPSVSEQQA